MKAAGREVPPEKAVLKAGPGHINLPYGQEGEKSSQQEAELYRAQQRGQGLQFQAASTPTTNTELPSDRPPAPQCSPLELEYQDQQHTY